MEAGDISSIRSIPLFQLYSATETLLSNLLNSTKVLPTQGPIRRHRDWRGLASLVNISAEVEATLWNHNDKTRRILELWAGINRTATVGDLLDHLVTLDRYDAYDDIIESIQEEMRARPANQVALQNNNHCSINNNIQSNNEVEEEILTLEDRHGYKHKYDAFVLYAKEDESLVIQIKKVAAAHNLEICTKDNLLPGFSSQYPPIAKLIKERCRKIIIVFSPEFLLSRDNSFFRDFAQADSIMFNVRKLVPIMYRQCVLPPHMSIYCMLYYNCAMNLFWDKLLRTLQNSRVNSMPSDALPQINVPMNMHAQNNLAQSNSHSAVNITTMPNSDSDDRYFLTPNVPNGSTTPGAVSLAPSTLSLAPSTASLPERFDSLNLDSTNKMIKPKKKKRNLLVRSINFLKGKKQVIENGRHLSNGLTVPSDSLSTDTNPKFNSIPNSGISIKSKKTAWYKKCIDYVITKMSVKNV